MMQEHADFDVALTKYRLAAHNAPDKAQLWNNIAMCFYGKHKFVAAISCLKRANYLAPLDWKILYNLGLAHLAMEQYASAFHFLSSAINVQPKMAQLFGTLAVVLTRLGDYQNARLAHKKCTEFDQRDPTAALNFAIFFYKRGEPNEAIKWLADYQTRLANMKDISKGQFIVDQDEQDMAEKLKTALNSGQQVPNSEENEEEWAMGEKDQEGVQKKPSYLTTSDPFAHEQVNLPRQPTQSDDFSHQEARPDFDSVKTPSSGRLGTGSTNIPPPIVVDQHVFAEEPSIAARLHSQGCFVLFPSLTNEKTDDSMMIG